MSNLKPSNPKDAIGVKKVPLWLCSAVAKAHWAAAQFSGLIKYGAWNWRSAGVRSSVYVSAMGRHIDAYSSGEDCDPIDRTRHLGNIMACAAILLDAEAAGKLIDDRGPQINFRRSYSEVEQQMAFLIEHYAEYLPGGPKCPVHFTIDGPVLPGDGRVTQSEASAEIRHAIESDTTLTPSHKVLDKAVATATHKAGRKGARA